MQLIDHRTFAKIYCQIDAYIRNIFWNSCKGALKHDKATPNYGSTVAQWLKVVRVPKRNLDSMFMLNMDIHIEWLLIILCLFSNSSRNLSRLFVQPAI